MSWMSPFVCQTPQQAGSPSCTAQAQIDIETASMLCIAHILMNIYWLSHLSTSTVLLQAEAPPVVQITNSTVRQVRSESWSIRSSLPHLRTWQTKWKTCLRVTHLVSIRPSLRRLVRTEVNLICQPSTTSTVPNRTDHRGYTFSSRTATQVAIYGNWFKENVNRQASVVWFVRHNNAMLFKDCDHMTGESNRFKLLKLSGALGLNVQMSILFIRRQLFV